MSKERKERVSKITSQFKSDLKRAVSHKKCDVARLKQAMKDIVAMEALIAVSATQVMTGCLFTDSRTTIR